MTILMENYWIKLSFVTVLMVFIPKNVKASVLYQTGFEPPTYTPGLLAGQDEWFVGLSPDAATVSTELPSIGTQSMKIQGSEIEEFFGFHQASYARPVNYDPLGSGTSLVDLSADINLSGAVPPTCGLGIGLSAILDDVFITNVVVGVREDAGSIVSYISNYDGVFTNGPEYELGEWANVSAWFNFETRTVLGFFNDQLIGEIPFTNGVSNDIHFVNPFLGSSEPVPDVVGYVDNLLVEAKSTPEASSCLPLLALSMLGAGLTFKNKLKTSKSKRRKLEASV